MALQIVESQVPITLERLNAVEARIGARLPEQYRSFLLKYNGGRPVPSGFAYTHPTGSYADSLVDWFLAIYDGPNDNWESYYRIYKIDAKRLPDELIPIAHDPFGNLVCISVGREDYGTVCFWDHVHESDFASGEPATSPNVHRIADTFDELLTGLRDM